mmetsp:Transcript_5030/g.16469  ORF Transcript_5030/g.16469 Transcript_5030/m.16469 type:complete len:237 (+) Transcript_5030:192-902(+)
MVEFQRQLMRSLYYGEEEELDSRENRVYDPQTLTEAINPPRQRDHTHSLLELPPPAVEGVVLDVVDAGYVPVEVSEAVGGLEVEVWHVRTDVDEEVVEVDGVGPVGPDRGVPQLVDVPELALDVVQGEVPFFLPLSKLHPRVEGVVFDVRLVPGDGAVRHADEAEDVLEARVGPRHLSDAEAIDDARDITVQFPEKRRDVRAEGEAERSIRNLGPAEVDCQREASRATARADDLFL